MTTKKRPTRPPPASGHFAVSPAKSTAEELRTLRKSFDAVLAGYAARIHRELDEVISAVERLELTADGALRGKDGREQTHDLRDMLISMRNLQVRPDKGRRKDLKKIDTTVGDLHLLIEHWSAPSSV